MEYDCQSERSTCIKSWSGRLLSENIISQESPSLTNKHHLLQSILTSSTLHHQRIPNTPRCSPPSSSPLRFPFSLWQHQHRPLLQVSSNPSPSIQNANKSCLIEQAMRTYPQGRQRRKLRRYRTRRGHLPRRVLASQQ